MGWVGPSSGADYNLPSPPQPPSPVYIGKGKAIFKYFIMCEFIAEKKVYIFGDETEI